MLYLHTAKWILQPRRSRYTNINYMVPSTPHKQVTQGGHVLADMKFPVFSLCFPCVAEIFPVFFIEELTVIVIKEMSLAPSYTIYFLLKPYTA